MALIAGPKKKAGGGNAPLLHVTDVFPAPTDSAVLRAACERGHAVHSLCEAHDRGRTQIVDPRYSGYYAAWVRFLAESGCEILENELRIGGPKFGYIGRLDRVAKMAGRLWVLDIKTGKPWPTHGPQTAAYEHAYRDEHTAKGALGKELRRACIHLVADGKYQIAEHKSVHDYHTFLAYLRIAQWEISNGLRERPKERD